MMRARLLDQIAIAVLVALSTYLLIGDFGVRLANTASDDGLVGYAYFFKFPELFVQDARMLNMGPSMLSTMLNWLPAALFKYAGVPPEICFWLFTFLQNILLALAVYRLTIVMTQSRESAWIAAIFTLAFRPHWWNMGLFADVDWMPYGSWSALPFLVFAGSYALEQRLGWTAMTLLIGGLVHPILGLFAAAMIGAYWLLLALRERKIRVIIVPYAVLGVTTIAFLLPMVLAKLSIDETPSAQILSMLLNNGHTIPWKSPDCTYCMPLFLKGLVAVSLMTALALAAAGHPSVHPGLRLFLLACAAVAFAACLLHIIAYFTKSATILRVVTFRSTILLLIFTVPPVIALAWRQFSGARILPRLLASYVVALPSPMALLAALLVLPRVDRQKRGAMARVSFMVGAVLLGLLAVHQVPLIGTALDAGLISKVLSPAAIETYFGFRSNAAVLILAWLCAIAAWQWWRSSKRIADANPTGSTKIALAVLAAPLIAFLLASNYQAGRAATTGEAREYFEVQAWARASTPRDASFIVTSTSVYEGWRNFTHRPNVTPRTLSCFYVCSQAALDYDRKITAFYARVGHASYIDMDAPSLREFARQFGGNFAVRRKEWKPVDLPIAFQNASYVVYDLR
jgi:hypothetical protein